MGRFNNRGRRDGGSKKQQRQANPPVKEFKAGSVKVCVWENEGEYGPYESYTLSRSYKPEDGDWVNQSISVPRMNDLVKAWVAIDAAIRDACLSDDDLGDDFDD